MLAIAAAIVGPIVAGAAAFGGVRWGLTSLEKRVSRLEDWALGRRSPST